jgi:hypothetical protein
MALSTFLRNAQLDHWRGVTYPAPPANLYIALFSGDPLRAGTGGTEITTSVRTAGRVAIASSGWDPIAASGDALFIANTASIAFGNAVSSATVTHVGVFDASTGGNYYGGATSPFTATSGAPVTIAAGALVIQLD